MNVFTRDPVFLYYDLTGKSAVLDTETVPEQPDYDAFSPLMQELWIERFTKTAPDSVNAAEAHRNQAVILPKLNKTGCVSACYINDCPGKQRLRVKPFDKLAEAILSGIFLKTIIALLVKYHDFSLAAFYS